MIEILLMFTVYMILYAFDINYTIRLYNMCRTYRLEYFEYNSLIRKYLGNDIMAVIVAYLLYAVRGTVSLVISMYFYEIGIFIFGFLIGSAYICLYVTYLNYRNVKLYVKLNMLEIGKDTNENEGGM